MESINGLFPHIKLARTISPPDKNWNRMLYYTEQMIAPLAEEDRKVVKSKVIKAL
jgi:hypothetical protein